MPIDPGAIVEFHRELVRIPGLSGQEGEVTRVVAARMRALNYDSVTTDEWGSVVGTIVGGQAGQGLLLDAHIDVVPPGDLYESSGAQKGAGEGTTLGCEECYPGTALCVPRLTY